MQEISSELHDRRRIAFFNERANGWLDKFYKDPVSGRYDKFKHEFDRLFSLIPVEPGDCVLDVGCGSGVLVPYILDKIDDSGVLYELDFADKMIEANREIHRDSRIRFIISNVLQMPLEPETCDGIICFSCFPHFGDKDAAVKSMARRLKQGGWFAVAHFDSSDKLNNHHRKAGGPVEHDMLPDKKMMFSLCDDAGLRVIKFIDEEGFYIMLAKKEKD